MSERGEEPFPSPPPSLVVSVGTFGLRGCGRAAGGNRQNKKGEERERERDHQEEKTNSPPLSLPPTGEREGRKEGSGTWKRRERERGGQSGRWRRRRRRRRPRRRCRSEISPPHGIGCQDQKSGRRGEEGSPTLSKWCQNLGFFFGGRSCRWREGIKNNRCNNVHHRRVSGIFSVCFCSFFFIPHFLSISSSSSVLLRCLSASIFFSFFSLSLSK